MLANRAGSSSAARHVRMVACLLCCLAVAATAFAQGSGYVRIQNRWKPSESINVEKGLASSPVQPAWWSADWVIEPVQGGFVRIKNRWKGTYLHNQNGPLEVGQIQPNWWSAMWVLEPVSGTTYFRLKNRWKGTYIHNQNGKIELGDAPPNWWSAMWTLNGYKPAAAPATAKADPPPAATAQRSATTAPAPPTPVQRPNAPSGGDPAATVASGAATAVGAAKPLALGTATENADITGGNSKTMKTLCSVLQSASAGIKGQVDKAKLRKAQEDLLDQWAGILFEVQNDTGVSVQSLDGEALANAMAKIQAEIDKNTPGAVVDHGEVIPTNYTVSYAGGAPKKGATSIALTGPAKFMVLNKTIVFENVPGNYKLTQSYDGKSGSISISPGLTTVPPDGTAILTKPEWTSFDIARTSLEVAGIADPTGVVAVAAAYLHPVCNTDEADRSRGDFCYKESDTRGVGVIPIACNPNTPHKQAGLCYKNCDQDYHGVGPVCWTNEDWSVPRGAGVIPANCPATHPSFEGGLCYKTCDPGWKAVGTICYKQCPDGYRDDGLYCGKTTYNRGAGYPLWDREKCNKKHADVGGCEQKGLLIYPKCKPGFEMTTVNFCQTKGCPAGYQDIGVSCKMPSKGRGVGVARNGCAANVPDLDAGLCYKNCPDGYRGVGPVCWTEKATSKPRGAGVVPDQCAPSHPNFDAGLCYRNCPNPAYAGVGPVCWGTCGGRYPVQCGVGCATSKISCGLVTTEMVVAPLEMIASIASLGGYSLVDKAKDSAKVAFKNAVGEAAEASAKEMGATVGQQALLKFNKTLGKLDNFGKALTKRKEAIKKVLKENTFDPVKDAAVKSWKKGADNRLQKKIAKASNDLQAELIRDGAQKKFIKEAADARYLDPVNAEALKIVSQEAAEKAAREKAGRLLKRNEIKDKLLSLMSKSWNNTDKAWLAVGQKCAVAGVNVADDLGLIQP